MNNRFEKIENEKFIEIFNISESKGEICRKLNLPDNGTSRKYIDKMIKELKLNIQILKENHFNKYHIKKICPVCGKEFYTPTAEKGKNKICCSYSCSNTYFRSGENNGVYKGSNLSGRNSYITICFRHHPHKCCVCGEENIVAVHHYDGNHNNNEISNLIPLCPTHHCYIHSRFKNKIQDKVDEYRNNFLCSDSSVSSWQTKDNNLFGTPDSLLTERLMCRSAKPC